MNFLRSALFNLYYSLITITIGSVSALGSLFVGHKPMRPLVRGWTYLVVYGLRAICGVRFEEEGELPSNGQNYVVMAKHQSSWETFYLQMRCEPISTILKKELLRIPFFGWGLRLMAPVAIDRSNPVKALKQVKEQGIDRLKQGRNLLVFPEGTRAAPGVNLKHARSGADIAIAAGVPVVPVAHNAGLCWINKRFTKKPGTITVVIGEAIATEGKTSRQLSDEIQRWIETQQARIEATGAIPTTPPSE